MEYGVADSETKLPVDEPAITSANKSHLDLSGKTPNSRVNRGRHHSELEEQEHIQTTNNVDGNPLDMSVEPEVLSETGCAVNSKRCRWENSEEYRNADPDDDGALLDHRAAVDLSTSKSLSTSVHHEFPDRSGHVTSDSDPEEFPDTASHRRQCLYFTLQPRSPHRY